MTCMKLVPIMAEARKYHILGVAGDSKRFHPRISTTRTEVLVSIGGSDRPMGYSYPYVESWVIPILLIFKHIFIYILFIFHFQNPKKKKWKQIAELPPFSNKTENQGWAVCNIKNLIILTGGRVGQRDVWIYQVCFLFF